MAGVSEAQAAEEKLLWPWGSALPLRTQRTGSRCGLCPREGVQGLARVRSAVCCISLSHSNEGVAPAQECSMRPVGPRQESQLPLSAREWCAGPAPGKGAQSDPVRWAESAGGRWSRAPTQVHCGEVVPGAHTGSAGGRWSRVPIQGPAWAQGGEGPRSAGGGTRQHRAHHVANVQLQLSTGSLQALALLPQPLACPLQLCFGGHVGPALLVQPLLLSLGVLTLPGVSWGVWDSMRKSQSQGNPRDQSHPAGGRPAWGRGCL